MFLSERSTRREPHLSTRRTSEGAATIKARRSRWMEAETRISRAPPYPEISRNRDRSRYSTARVLDLIPLHLRRRSPQAERWITRPCCSAAEVQAARHLIAVPA